VHCENETEPQTLGRYRASTMGFRASVMGWDVLGLMINMLISRDGRWLNMASTGDIGIVP
jgi:hypothetical protein